MTTAALPQPSPAFETLSPHPAIPGARILPPDGRFSIDGEEWTVRGAKGVWLGADREPAGFVEPGASIEVMRPWRMAPDCKISIGFASPSLIEEADEPPVVLTAFGPAKGGSA